MVKIMNSRKASTKATATAKRNTRSAKPQPPLCQYCEGKGVVCFTCHRPLDVCECAGVDQPETCIACGGRGNPGA
jgi:hypothetical protein